MTDFFRPKTIKVLCVFVVMLSATLCFALFQRSFRESAEDRAYDVRPLTYEEIKGADSSDTRKLMIVAHPDDELLWGGGHLMSGDYLIVCITNGRNLTRAKEFADVAKDSGNKCIILDYPDKVGMRRDNWSKIRNDIERDVAHIMKYKKWDEIVTHNQNGEYGHIHHQTIHSLVTEIYDKANIDRPLYCFGKYYRKKDMKKVEKNLVPISDEEYEFKEKLAKNYVSQGKTMKNLWHMARYEMWTEYEKYSEHPSYKINDSKGDLNEA